MMPYRLVAKPVEEGQVEVKDKVAVKKQKGIMDSQVDDSG